MDLNSGPALTQELLVKPGLLLKRERILKIKLIAPRETEMLYFQNLQVFYEFYGPPVKAATPPLALPLLAALTPPDVDIEIIDENVSEIDFDDPVDLVGITGMTAMANRIYEICAEYKKRDVTVVMGGIHASMVPEEAALHADVVVIGEAEETWPQVINDYKNKCLKKYYKYTEYPDLTLSPIPRWDLLKPKAYLEIPVQTTRGCPFKCDFCTVHAMTGSSFRHKPIENIVAEIETLIAINGHRNITFVDDNIIGDKKFAIELFNALLKLNIKWISQVSINIADDDELLDLAKRSGMWQCPIGIESITQASLDSVNKGKLNKVDKHLEKIQKIHDKGISVFGAMIVGLDGDKEDVFKKTFDFLTQAKIPFSLLSILTPLPGTTTYHKLESEKRILDRNWDHYLPAFACIKPNGMSRDALQNGFLWLAKNLYYYGNTISRLKHHWANGLHTNVSKVNMLNTCRGMIRISKLMMDRKLTRFIPLTAYYVFFRNAHVRGILMAIHLHQASYELDHEIQKVQK